MQSSTVIGEASAASAARKERRRSRRFPCDGFAEGMVLQPECLFRGQMLDVSEHGCFVMTRARLRLETQAEVDLRFTLSGAPFRTHARVIDVRPEKGVALEFLFVDAHAEGLFKELIRMLSANRPMNEG